MSLEMIFMLFSFGFRQAAVAVPVIQQTKHYSLRSFKMSFLLLGCENNCRSNSLMVTENHSLEF